MTIRLLLAYGTGLAFSLAIGALVWWLDPEIRLLPLTWTLAVGGLIGVATLAVIHVARMRAERREGAANERIAKTQRR